MALCAKLASKRLPGVEVAFLRFVFGIASGLVAMVYGLRLSFGDKRGLALRGLFGGIAVVFYFTALSHLSVGLATLLNYSSPMFTAIFAAIFLAEPVPKRLGLGLFVATVGLVLQTASGSGDGGGPFGILRPLLPKSADAPYVALGMFSAVLSGAAVTQIRALRRGASGKASASEWEIFLALCGFGALVSLPPTLWSWVTPEGSDWLYLFLAGLSSVVAQLLLSYGLRHVPAALGGLFLLLTPACCLVLGIILLGDPPSGRGLVGATLTLLGVAFGGTSPKKIRAKISIAAHEQR